MSLEIIFRQIIARFKAGEHTRNDLFNWLLSDGNDGSEGSGGQSFSHRLLKEVQTKHITWMLSFIADALEGEIFAFMMSRDLEDNTIGHVVCSQAFSEKHDVINSGLLDAFLGGMGKLSARCRPDFLEVRNQAGQRIDDVVREIRFDAVKQVYYRFFQAAVFPSLQSRKSAFTRLPKLEITIPPNDTSDANNRAPSMSRKKGGHYPMFFEPSPVVSQSSNGFMQQRQRKKLPSNSAASTTTDVAVIEDAAESKKVTKTGEWTP